MFIFFGSVYNTEHKGKLLLTYNHHNAGMQPCLWSKNVNELVSTHGYSQNQIMVWKYPSMAKVLIFLYKFFLNGKGIDSFYFTVLLFSHHLEIVLVTQLLFILLIR